MLEEGARQPTPDCPMGAFGAVSPRTCTLLWLTSALGCDGGTHWELASPCRVQARCMSSFRVATTSLNLRSVVCLMGICSSFFQRAVPPYTCARTLSARPCRLARADAGAGEPAGPVWSVVTGSLCS